MKQLLILLLFFQFSVFAQTYKRCAVPHNDSLRQVHYPNLKTERQKFEVEVQQYLRDRSNKNLRAAETVIKIPVVVHVIHNNSAGTIGGPNNTNISDEQIMSQIEVLNEDYRRKINTTGFNDNPVGADMGIEFYLALRDPKGVPTNGINRVYSSQSSFDIYNDLEKVTALSYWDSNRYLNVWVLNVKDDYIGYANFPGAENVGGLESDDVSEKLDGLFIHYRAFGRQIGTATRGAYSLGRTTTHEVGHWLGLIHTWGDEFCGTDYVADTPPTESQNLSQSCAVKYSKCDGRTSTRNMTENYMDYSPDACMNIFTAGQKNRVRAILELSKRRRRLVMYGQNPLPNSEKLAISVFPNPSGTVAYLEVLLPKFENINVYVQDMGGSLLYHQEINDTPSLRVELPTERLATGLYIITVATADEVAKTRWVLKR